MKEYTKQTKITKPFVLLHCSSHRPFTNKQKSPCTLPPPCVLLFPQSRIASRRNIPDTLRCYCSVSLTLTHPYTAATTTIALTLCSRRALNFAHSLSLSLIGIARIHACIHSQHHSQRRREVCDRNSLHHQHILSRSQQIAVIHIRRNKTKRKINTSKKCLI